MSDLNQQPTGPEEQPGFFDKPSNVTLILRVFYALCLLLVLLDFLLHRHIYTDIERIPAFYAIYGFIACVVLVVIAKKMRKFMMRKEDYYDGNESEVPHDEQGDN
ncbi:hypothetical protein [Aliiglaciecola sp. LCG003]|uniref:hypothetical protein n=1 Tax=Aliiglaciecola sp. LCG003 TaxID=3053655 RepID=UPI0025743A4E|nr:hypothetical protein [Aliiglaciecola sp. LCG003]WJG08220.1 hypothetical protein QR722_12825 [Aliiglaciecola sp. LCG003]